MSQTRAIHTWECVAGVLVAFSTAGRMDDAIWDAMIVDLQTKPLVGYLGCTVGATDTTSSQRKKATDTLKKRNLPCSIVTDNRFVVGVVTMVSWMFSNIKAHDWLHAMDAIRWIGVSDGDAQQVFEALMRMRYAALSELSPVSNAG